MENNTQGTAMDSAHASYKAGISGCIMTVLCKVPVVSTHIYGGGPLATKLKIIAPGNIHFHGQQNDMTLVWSNIALLVMLSRHEGLPMAAAGKSHADCNLRSKAEKTCKDKSYFC